MAVSRITISLEEGLATFLDNVHNKSGYLARLLEHRWRAWQQALESLTLAGWNGPALMAACDALNGVWLTSHSAGTYMALELADAQRLNEICAKWKVEPDAWAAIIDRLRVDTAAAEREAQALRIIVEEFWAGNNKLEARLEVM